MKKLLLLILFVAVSLGCDKDDYISQNPYIPNVGFDITLNLELPSYSQLNFPSSPVRIFQAGAGYNGIIVMKTGSGYVAWEVTCPNQPITQCSILELEGLYAVCPCDEVSYSLFDGTGAGEYPLKRYRVDVLNPSLIRVYN
jgi:nitrite reductase/ring-hydroxylating ferredoxin subunit